MTRQQNVTVKLKSSCHDFRSTTDPARDKKGKCGGAGISWKQSAKELRRYTS